MKWSKDRLELCRAEIRKMIPVRPSPAIDIMSPEWDKYMVRVYRLLHLRNYLISRTLRDQSAQEL